MRSVDLVVGNKYQIKYRTFSANGSINYNEPLKYGIGMLVSMYDAGNYNHSFVLESSGERVWATPNSVVKQIDGTVGSNVNLASDIVGPNSVTGKSLANISSFLKGIGIHNKVIDDNIVIPPESAGAFNKLLHKLYSDILDF